MKKWPLLIISLLFQLNSLFSQDCSILIWQTGEKLTHYDFCIKVTHHKNSNSFAQFSIDYKPPVFGLFSNNFNRNVTNKLIREASWIDTASGSMEETVRYQQILFDMAEVYCRKFRMEILKNKRKIALDVSLIEEINVEIMKALSKKRAVFEAEYADGQDETVKIQWETWIKNELDILSDFDYHNLKKIKLK